MDYVKMILEKQHFKVNAYNYKAVNAAVREIEEKYYDVIDYEIKDALFGFGMWKVVNGLE